jgi:hypothetical protein
VKSGLSSRDLMAKPSYSHVTSAEGGITMSRLIRLDRTGHTELASWTAEDGASQRAAIEAFRRELDEGMLASTTLPDGSAEVVRELPLDADLVVMRRPIAGG